MAWLMSCFTAKCLYILEIDGSVKGTNLFVMEMHLLNASSSTMSHRRFNRHRHRRWNHRLIGSIKHIEHDSQCIDFKNIVTLRLLP
ncbi:hypothetical protein GDO86_014820 [Hymenochirus boettgeri]|uniref:Uncharacterized protein n=1 Tax=Hymenochirus boettgeri TaxID=247094 RepID=A0A8T2JYI1_9PIPI|nr:hypothetical protein GDO86_014820 [Hymenochirus boettgeri]